MDLTSQLDPKLRDATLDKLGDRTHAYTADDLESLVNRACDIAEQRVKRLIRSGEGEFKEN